MAPFKVEFTNRGRAAGIAHIGEHRITFNPKVMRLNPDRFLKRTPGHEVAHFVVHYLYEQRVRSMERPPPKPKAHGREWLSVMMSLGITDNSTRNTYQMTEGKVATPNLVSSRYQSVHGQVQTMGMGKIVEFD